MFAVSQYTLKVVSSSEIKKKNLSVLVSHDCSKMSRYLLSFQFLEYKEFWRIQEEGMSILGWWVMPEFRDHGSTQWRTTGHFSLLNSNRISNSATVSVCVSVSILASWEVLALFLCSGFFLWKSWSWFSVSLF